MLSHKKVIAGTLLVMASQLAIANNDIGLPHEITPEVIESLQHQKRLAEALYELEEIQKKRRDLNIDQNSGMMDPNSMSNNMNMGMPQTGYSNMNIIEPVVVSVEGKASDLRALLLVGQGQTIRVRAGQEVSGWKIIKIEADGVTASKNGREKFLAFSEFNHIQPQTNYEY